MVNNARLDAEILEMAVDLRPGSSHPEQIDKITMRILGQRPPFPSLSGEDIRKLRENAHMSQAVFASLLNIATGYLSQLERGEKRAAGATLALLHLVRRNGVNPLLHTPEMQVE